jgi:hypothetical protein
MYDEPVRNYDLENGITYDHPEWNDRSLLTLSPWAGLTFPQKPIVVLRSP